MSSGSNVHVVAVETARHPAFQPMAAFQPAAFGDVGIAGVRALAVAAGHPGLVVADEADAEAAGSALVAWARGLSMAEQRRLRGEAAATLYALLTLAFAELGFSPGIKWQFLGVCIAWKCLFDALDDTRSK